MSAGASLTLCWWAGLGEVAAVTGVSTIMLQSKSRSSAETEASRLVSASLEKEVTLGLLHKITAQIVSSTKKLHKL